MYGAKTPMYGSQTPLYDGSRTPHYGGMTPQHEGSSTPGRSSAWDPANANTPNRLDNISHNPLWARNKKAEIAYSLDPDEAASPHLDLLCLPSIL